LYQNIINAEETSKKTIQEVICQYFYFGKALEGRFNHWRKNNPKRTAQGLVNNSSTSDSNDNDSNSEGSSSGSEAEINVNIS